MAIRVIGAMAIAAADAACPPAQTSLGAVQALVHKLRHRLTDRDFAMVAAAAVAATQLDLSRWPRLDGAVARQAAP